MRSRRAAAVLLALVALPLPVGAARARAADAGGGASAAGTTAADAPTVAARADRSEVNVGDPITLTITAVGPQTTPVNLPAVLDLDPFVQLQPPKDGETKSLGDGRVSHSFVLTLAVYETGTLEIPPLDVTYLAKGGHVLAARTAPVPITIKSLIANEPEPKLRDNAPPVSVLEENYIPLYVAAGLLVAGLGALVALAVRKRLRERAAYRPPPPPKPPHEIALERLDALAGQGFAEGGDFRPFTFQVSEVVREYLGRRFGFDALEMTTEELLDELERRAGRDLVMGEVAGWLTGCDLVKFAKISPTAHEARGTFETAVRLVESTRPRAEPLVGETGGAPPASPPPDKQGSAHG